MLDGKLFPLCMGTNADSLIVRHMLLEILRRLLMLYRMAKSRLRE